MEPITLKISNNKAHYKEGIESSSKYSDQDKQKLSKASKEFESMLTSMMIKSMTKKRRSLVTRLYNKSKRASKMNIPIFIAGILSLLAFTIHAFIGDREYKSLKPEKTASPKVKETWVQVRSGWHWVSVDLLLSIILLSLLATTELKKQNQKSYYY